MEGAMSWFGSKLPHALKLSVFVIHEMLKEHQEEDFKCNKP